MAKRYKCISCSTKDEPIYIEPLKEYDDGGEWNVCPECGSIELEPEEVSLDDNY